MLKKLYSAIVSRLRVYRQVPFYIKERNLMALKKVLYPYYHLDIWVTTKNGAKIFLGRDHVDEYILEDVCKTMESIYFPRQLSFDKGDIALDVGGHHGIFAMEFAARFPSAKVICVEPDKEGIQFIGRHIRKNKVEDRVTLVPYALGNSDKEGYLVDNNDGSWGKTVETEALPNAIKIRMKPLDVIVDAPGKVRFVKSNCEGGEFDLVPEMIRLNMKPDIIVLMIHPDRGDMQQLINSLNDHGYDSKPVIDSKTNPCWHFIKRK